MENERASRTSTKNTHTHSTHTMRTAVFSQFATMGRLPWQWMVQRTKRTHKDNATATNNDDEFQEVISIFVFTRAQQNKRSKAHSKNGLGHKAIEESLLPSRFTNVLIAQLYTFLNFECTECGKLAPTTCQLKKMLTPLRVFACVCVLCTRCLCGDGG